MFNNSRKTKEFFGITKDQGSIKMDKDSYNVHHHHSSAAAGVGVFPPTGSGNMLERGEIVKMSAAGMSASSHGVGAGAPGVPQGDMTLHHMPHVPYSINGLPWSQ